MHLLVLRYVSLKVGLSGVSIISPKCSSKPSKLVIIEIQTFSSFQQLLNLYISLLACKVLISALFLKVSLCKCMIWKPANLNWVWHVFGSEWIPLFWNLPCVSQQFSQVWFQSLNPPPNEAASFLLYSYPPCSICTEEHPEVTCQLNMESP